MSLAEKAVLSTALVVKFKVKWALFKPRVSKRSSQKLMPHQITQMLPVTDPGSGHQVSGVNEDPRTACSLLSVQFDSKSCFSQRPILLYGQISPVTDAVFLRFSWSPKSILMILHLYPCQEITNTNPVSLKSRANDIRVHRPQRQSHADPDARPHYAEIK